MINDSWGYAHDDHNWKSSRHVIRQLIEVASKGGNYLLNVGPKASGEFTPETAERLNDVGEWTRVNGRSIYQTQKCPLTRLGFNGHCTARVEENSIFLHVFEWPQGGLRVSGLKHKVKQARALNGNETLEIKDQNEMVLISKPKTLDPHATVIELSFD